MCANIVDINSSVIGESWGRNVIVESVAEELVARQRVQIRPQEKANEYGGFDKLSHRRLSHRLPVQFNKKVSETLSQTQLTNMVASTGSATVCPIVKIAK